MFTNEDIAELERVTTQAVKLDALEENESILRKQLALIDSNLTSSLRPKKFTQGKRGCR